MISPTLRMIGWMLLVFLSGGCALTVPSKNAATDQRALSRAGDAFQAWQHNPQDARALHRYQHTLAELIRWLDKVPIQTRDDVCKNVGLEIEFTHETKEGLQRVLPATDVDRSVMDHWHARSGIGVPVVAWRPNDGSGKWDTHRPPEGIAYGMTAVLTPSTGDASLWTLSFHDPYAKDSITIGQKTYALAGDYSSSYAFVIKRAQALRKSGRSGMLNPSASKRKEKLYLIQPYDPNRIPLLMVHGLQSTPVTFGNLSCEIASDPELYKRYQIWHYHYPTGTPVLVNAAIFRQTLDETLRMLDPEGDDFATRHLFVIGHSMGGILTHTLTCDSDYKLWDSVMTARPDKFVCTPDFRQKLEPVFLFKQEKRVKRVIFVAAPHRGSSYADNWIGDLGQRLYRGDHEFHNVFADLIRNHRDQINPFLRQLIDSRKVSSIRTLSSRSPALMALSTILPKVPFHNIMGQKKPGPVEQGSDGIVPYTSSRMDGAESELIVREGHNAFKHPDAVKEIKRILHLHIGSKYQSQAYEHRRADH